MSRTVARRSVRELPARRSERGFTLVEMLVVITIISIVMSLVGPRVLNYLADSKVKAAKIQIESFESALDFYRLDAGQFPSTSEGLHALIERPGNSVPWGGPYLRGDSVPNDPWGRPYIYRSPGQHGAYDIMSYGVGGEEGGADAQANITSWTKS
jgi:general secretion pathway protein G